MSERRDLLVSIANEIKTYREGELAQPTPEHVDRWASQFTPANQVAFLREFNHVIKQTFITKVVFSNFLSNLVTNAQLAGNDPRRYWERAEKQGSEFTFTSHWSGLPRILWTPLNEVKQRR